jgi:hypothetical protein
VAYEWKKTAGTTGAKGASTEEMPEISVAAANAGRALENQTQSHGSVAAPTTKL